MWVIRPGPTMVARSTVLCAAIWMLGDTFQPRPRSRPAAAPVPAAACPPSPGAPVGFSGLMERVSTRRRCGVDDGECGYSRLKTLDATEGTARGPERAQEPGEGPPRRSHGTRPG